MRKLIAAINITLDGFCDHTAVIANEELHEHYTRLLNSADTILYGRITYQLMEYWRPLVKNPTGKKSIDEFAVTMNNISKIVFSNTLKDVDWETAKLAKRGLKEEVLELKESANGGSKSILVGSPSLIATLTQLHLIDEYQLCVHPVILGHGLPLFKNIDERIILKLFKTKIIGSDSIVLYYEPVKK